MIIRNLYQKKEYIARDKFTKVSIDGNVESNLRSIFVEHKMHISVGERLKFSTVCTPDNLSEMIVGRLVSDDIIDELSDIESIYISEDGVKAKVFLKSGINCLRLQSDELGGLQLSDEKIFEIIDSITYEMTDDNNAVELYRCFLWHEDQIKFSCEDVGRRNAIDKAIGYIFLENLKPSECVIFNEGRITEDIMLKVVHAGIKNIISKSLPTMQAVQCARENGIQMVWMTDTGSFEK